MANLVFEASLGWGKGCIRFGGRSDENSGFHGNRKLPLTYNGENVVRSISTSFLIGASSNLQVTRTAIKSRTRPTLKIFWFAVYRPTHHFTPDSINVNVFGLFFEKKNASIFLFIYI